MMTDRELLKLAAKAAGLDVWTDIDGNYYCYAHETVEVPWNPLTDDGDALRLAVKLGICVDFSHDQMTVTCFSVHALKHFIAEACDNDPYAATRRAIVRAAAAVGKGMK